MAKKADFSKIQTNRSSRIIENMEKSTSKRGQQGTASPEEKAEREAAGRTQGRKGCKKPGTHLNLLLTPDNREFVKTMARASGVPMGEYINNILDQFRAAHPEYMEKASQFLEFLDEQKKAQ